MSENRNTGGQKVNGNGTLAKHLANSLASTAVVVSNLNIAIATKESTGAREAPASSSQYSDTPSKQRP